MAPVITDVAAALGEVAMRGKRKGGAVVSQGRAGPFVFTRIRNFFVLFSFFRVNDDVGRFIAALAFAFMFAVIATIVAHLLEQFERDVLAKRGRVAAMERLGAGVSFGIRKLLLYVSVLFVTVRSLWLLLSLLFGHVVGWVILSSFFNLPVRKIPIVALQAKKKSLENDDVGSTDSEDL